MMRIVHKNDPTWRIAGVAAADIAPLLNVSIEERWNCMSLWGDLIYKRDVIKMRKEPQLEQGSESWLDWRRKGVTASTVGTMVGLKQFNNTIDTVYDEKVKIVKETAENEHMQRGKRLEAPVRQLYESLMGWRVEPVCVLHDEYDFVRASLDGIREDSNLIVEIKCPGVPNHTKMYNISKEHDPLARQRKFASYFNFYRYQVLYMLMITGAKMCHFLSYNEDHLFEHNKLVTIELYAEPVEQQRLLDRVIEFWKFVETRTPPPREWCANCSQAPTELAI